LNNTEDSSRFTFTLPESILKRAKDIARIEQRSIGWVIREAVETFVSGYPFPPQQLTPRVEEIDDDGNKGSLKDGRDKNSSA
jgi:hypothetical protein